MIAICGSRKWPGQGRAGFGTIEVTPFLSQLREKIQELHALSVGVSSCEDNALYPGRRVVNDVAAKGV